MTAHAAAHAVQALTKKLPILLKNSTQTPNPALKIGCNAVQCIHNENHLCQAESVAINGMNTQSGNHTECATFQADNYKST